MVNVKVKPRFTTYFETFMTELSATHFRAQVIILKRALADQQNAAKLQQSKIEKLQNELDRKRQFVDLNKVNLLREKYSLDNCANTSNADDAFTHLEILLRQMSSVSASKEAPGIPKIKSLIFKLNKQVMMFSKNLGEQFQATSLVNTMSKIANVLESISLLENIEGIFILKLR